jgi:hypothetical protein
MALLVSPSDPGAARPARIAVRMVAGGGGVPPWENSLAPRMIWPHHPVDCYPLAHPPARTVAISPRILKSLAHNDGGPAIACLGRLSYVHPGSRSLRSVIFQQEDE